ncbi:MAG: RNA methyltransferase [Desulfobacterales bacterium]|nr:RNA methyltransferase [Desulfobacterales bacterium]MDX2510656.1 RNA methyltransferase [Desulfobacterales bacterium]
MQNIHLDNIHIVLMQPRYPENIGSVARAMRNMGLRHLSVVDPENFDLSRAHKLATHVAADVIDRCQTYEDLKTALASCQYVVGTTARLGKHRQVIQSPERLATRLIPISQENRVAILFGPEDRGLSNDDIRLCHALVNIPTADFSSLNLAQAVMVVSYTLFTSRLDQPTPFTPRLANRHELDGMYEQLKEILVRISYINSDNPDHFMNSMRRFFTRLQLRAREVSMVRGIIRQINWYGEKRYQDGGKDQEFRFGGAEGRRGKD